MKTEQKQDVAPARTDAGAQPAKPAPAKPSPSALRRWAYRLLAMTLVPALLFGILEVSLRMFGYGYPTSYFLAAPAELGRGHVVENFQFGLRFFPRELLRSPSPMFFAAQKPNKTYRIFVLGESAALGYPDPSQSFSRILEVMLRETFPSTRFEVINTSLVAINSHVVLPIARDCARLQPDLFIVHLGNNEVVGPFGAAGVIGPYAPSLSVIRSNLIVKTTRTGQLLGNFMQWFKTPAKKKPQDWDGMRMFMQSKLRADDERLKAIYDNHLANLRDICDVGASAGAAVMVCTVPVNLRDCAPFASMHNPNLTEAQLDDWKRIYQDGSRLEDARDFPAASARLLEAARIDDSFADLQFRLGRCCLALKQLDKARSHFLRARDLDALRFRSDSKINANLREGAGGREAEGIHLVDTERIFADASPGGIPGENCFLEHVHMNFSGNYLLARSLFEKVIGILPSSVKGAVTSAAPLTEKECADRMAFNDWNRHSMTSAIQLLMNTPPFTGQLDLAERAERWQKHVRQMLKVLPVAMKQAVEGHKKAIERAPRDTVLRMKFIELLMELAISRRVTATEQAGFMKSAAVHCEAVLELNPHDYHAHFKLGQLYQRLNQPDKSISHYRTAIAIEPHYASLYDGLAQVLGAAGKPDEAVALLKGRLSGAPNRARALLSLADLYISIGKIDEARKCLTDSVEADPDFASAQSRLGNLLAKQKDFKEAIEHLELALKIEPESVATEEDLAQALAAAGKTREAIAIFEKHLARTHDRPGVLIQLADFLIGIDRANDAYPHVAEALKLEPGSATAHIRMGRILAKQGRTNEAIKQFEEALRILPEAMDIEAELQRVRAKASK